MGMIVGLLLGLALALGVALYVTKVPVPFVDKVPQHTPQQQAAEAERNKSWNPNASLGTAKPVPPLPPRAPAASGNIVPEAGAPPAPVPDQARAPAPVPAPAKPGAEPFVYFVQVGAFAQAGDAEQQRARVGLAGLTARVTEREQAGRTVYRVRIGPIEARDEAEKVKAQVLSAGLSEATLVRVQRN